MVTLVPHTSHRLQPLDRSVFGPMKPALKTAEQMWMSRSAASRITPSLLPAFFTDAYSSSAKKRFAINSFRRTGIFPFNRNIFSDSDFAPCTMILQATSQAQLNREPLRPESPRRDSGSSSSLVAYSHFDNVGEASNVLEVPSEDACQAMQTPGPSTSREGFPPCIPPLEINCSSPSSPQNEEY